MIEPTLCTKRVKTFRAACAPRFFMSADAWNSLGLHGGEDITFRAPALGPARASMDKHENFTLFERVAYEVIERVVRSSVPRRGPAGACRHRAH
ncbi:hypothetical protein EVAR_13733_1 [Eumeta japonica]|uniref:Uncharacterized protein n=1 Tax=Eumeta variegata TaxID=151549 RepID=A0A4C1UCW6_EUMVA|nr:hypothetical protein EVAR_13733_1 [Eumeta japonica]